ncbi:MAG: CoA-disulfide reductase, partial [Opitutae bacterium]
MSEHSPVLLMLAPLFAAVGCALLGLRWKSVAYPITIAGLIAALYFCLQTLVQVVDSPTHAISYFLGGWNATDFPRGIGIEYRVDMLNAIVLVVIAFVALLAALFSKRFVPKETPDREPQYYTLFLLLATGL